MSAHFKFHRTTLSAAILTALASGLAQADMPTPSELRHDLATPDSQIEAGIGIISGNSQRFTEFRGIDNDSTFGLLNLNLIKRDDATGTWLKLKGGNLGQDNRGLRFEHERQGDWSYYLDGSQLTRREPWLINTGLAGIGSNQQTVNGTGKRDVDFRIKHDALALGARKFMLGGVDVRISFKQDEKHGERMYGRGITGVMEFLAEPLDSITRQWDVVAGYADRKLQLSGGYSGSAFENNNASLKVSGTNFLLDTLAATAIPQLALPPSNSAHQFHLAGGYNFTDTTRSSFKISHNRAYQNSDFATPSLAGESLDGRMITTLAFADLSLRPAERLDVTANLRYEDRDDQTPVQKFLSTSAPGSAPSLSSAGVSGYNVPRSLQQWKGMLEAGYRLADDYRLVGSIEQEQISRNIPEQYRRVGYREQTDETQFRLALSHNLSEFINGSLAYSHSNRGGSDYVNDTYTVSAAAPTNQINPLIWADRKRDKVRLTMDWTPDEAWSIQLMTDLSADHYGGRALGPREGKAMFVSADATYAINNKWKLSGWISQEQTTAEQTTHTDYNSSTGNADKGVLWEANIRNRTTAYGLTLKGKPRENLQISADLSSSMDTAAHNLARLGVAGTPSAPGNGISTPESLPSYFYRQYSFKLSADYALQRNSGLRGMLVYDHRRTNDWTWAGFSYTDGTTVSQADLQNTSYLGLSYYYRWR